LYDLKDMVAVVVGGADNIGRATAVMLAQAGARVAIGYHSNRDGAEQGVEIIRSNGGEAIALQIDHTDEAQITDFVSKSLARFGKINVAINNAARLGPDVKEHDLDVVQMREDYWDQVMKDNLKGPMLVCKHVVPHMIAAGYGSIVNTSSGAVFRGDTVRTAYSASKIGLHSLTMDIATAYGARNVRCNVVSPGLVMTTAMRNGMDAASMNAVAGQNLVPFIGEPDDIAHVHCFLASKASRYITGQIIAVDGGLHVHQCVVGQA
jgi:NAD(P)-dependent dehydrogenase (short-subunit alcohol dehydrogenase family)